MVTCSSCGTRNPQGTRYCNACGNRLTDAALIRCPACGATHASTTAYCTLCGNSLASVSPPAPPETLQADVRPARHAKPASADAESGSVARQRLLRVTQRDRLEEITAPPDPAPNIKPRSADESEAELDAVLFALLRKKLGLAYDEIREVIVRRKDGYSIRLRPQVTNQASAEVAPRNAPTEASEPSAWVYASKKK